MPSPDDIRKTVLTYVDMMCASDIDGIMSLFADDCTAEDPVGADVKQGMDAVREFYSFAAPMLNVELRGPVCVAGNNCAFLVHAQLTQPDGVSYLDATDVFAFNDDGKITSMKAYWNFEDVRAEP